ncbi:dihydrofolate reductase [Rhizobium halophytocola]|uniref:Dihydrofolate reductase n=1 Tax=Rhizobium halophytocola TaxID=735519 RepID=A0ABS4E6D2_9HYPH|nr:dihydrofolate reductase [Rhizobium halophytocola]MBP1853505.1 dihydrofolate reductase [Rhizobium halophytocola]
MAEQSGKPEISMVVAVARNGVIGRDNDMPWRLSTDLKRFKALTLGKPLVMGRRTFQSFGSRPLPGRPHIVVTRDAAYAPEGVETAPGLEAALERAAEIAAATGVDEICVIGGGQIYAQAMPFADVLHVTHVDAEIEGDTVFPPVDPDMFEPVEQLAVPAGEKDNYPTKYVVYRRKSAL